MDVNSEEETSKSSGVTIVPLSMIFTIVLYTLLYINLLCTVSYFNMYHCLVIAELMFRSNVLKHKHAFWKFPLHYNCINVHRLKPKLIENYLSPAIRKLFLLFCAARRCAKPPAEREELLPDRKGVC